MALLDIEAVKTALAYEFVINMPKQDTVDGYTGLKYFDLCLQRYSFSEPKFDYVWFGTLSNECITIDNGYLAYTDESEKYVESTLVAPVFTSHAEISKNRKTGKWCICHISVHSEYQNQGLSKVLIQDIVNFCKTNNIHEIQRTRPSDEGYAYLYDNLSKTLNEACIAFSEYGS